MDTKLKTYRMLKTAQGARNGINVETFQKGETYQLEEHLAEQFYHLGVIDEVTGKSAQGVEGGLDWSGGKKNPADNRSTKVTGPRETKVTGPTETKDGEGEAGVPLNTQRIEELVSVARDHYGLEVDSTMEEAQIEKLIEQAKADSDESSDEDKPAKPLTRMSKAELVSHAMENGLELVPDSMTNKEMIAAIEKHQKR